MGATTEKQHPAQARDREELAALVAAGAHPKWQEKWGLTYIKGRYGSPANAWAHELKVGWYANGGHPAIGGILVVGENGPEIIRTSGPTQVYPSDVSARMARQMASVVAGTAVGTAAAPGSVRPPAPHRHHGRLTDADRRS